MTRPIPGRNELVNLGVRRRVATEYLRLRDAGVNPASAAILARGPNARPIPDWTVTAADLLRRVSRKANCVRWHGPACGCHTRG